jgi:hypothetical protein
MISFLNKNKKNNLIHGDMISDKKKKMFIIINCYSQMQDVDDNMLDKVMYHPMDNNDDQFHHSIVMNNP